MAKAKRQPTPADMARSMAVLLIPVIVIAFLFTRNPPDDAPVPTVEWQSVLAVAREEAPYPVLAPPSTPEGWRATKASWLPVGRAGTGGAPSPRNTWELGFLNRETVYLSLEQGDAAIPQLISEASRSGRPDGTSTIKGADWERRITDDGRTRSLVLQEPKVTTVIRGDTGYDALDAYAATLISS